MARIAGVNIPSQKNLVLPLPMFMALEVSFQLMFVSRQTLIGIQELMIYQSQKLKVLVMLFHPLILLKVI